jgi:hypothetical protein
MAASQINMNESKSGIEIGYGAINQQDSNYNSINEIDQMIKLNPKSIN